MHRPTHLHPHPHPVPFSCCIEKSHCQQSTILFAFHQALTAVVVLETYLGMEGVVCYSGINYHLIILHSLERRVRQTRLLQGRRMADARRPFLVSNCMQSNRTKHKQKLYITQYRFQFCKLLLRQWALSHGHMKPVWFIHMRTSKCSEAGLKPETCFALIVHTYCTHCSHFNFCGIYVHLWIDHFCRSQGTNSYLEN